MSHEVKIPSDFDILSYDYEIDENQIAQKPADKRTESRLLILDKQSGEIEESRFSNISDYLDKDDLLVFNNTKVIPARLFGRKQSTGASIEILLTKIFEDSSWECLCRPAKRVKIGSIIEFTDENGAAILSCEVIKVADAGIRHIRFDDKDQLLDKLNLVGHMPLPPYIRRKDNARDRERYQTVYAKQVGAVAAPTAGLHFDDDLINKLKAKGICFAEVTLHVGIGTFRPIDVRDIRIHKMHSEFYSIDEETAKKINAHKQRGKKIVAIGTTSVRTLETSGFPLYRGQGETNIFIYPPYKFNVVDSMITNFHLPKSSLIVMVSAFCGRNKIMKAYEYAKNNDFRFFSYGDSMLIR